MRDLLSALAGKAQQVRNLAPVPYTSPSNAYATSGPDGDVQAAFDAHGSVGTLFAIVHQEATAVAKAEWHLYKRTSKRDKQRRTEVLNHGFMTVWNRPNQFTTGMVFRHAAQQHLDLTGEAFIVLVRTGGIIFEMWNVRPDRMFPVKDPDKFLLGWIYRCGGEEVPLKLDDVLQLKYPNPDDPYRGRGPVQTVLADIDAARYSAEWNRNFFINGARPGGIIKVDYRMSDNEFTAFVNRWRQQHQGVSNAHRVAVLENAEWVETNFSMSDMQFVQLRELSKETIREAFAFPKPMLGTVDDVNRANAEAGKEIMAEGQTIPRLDLWKDAVNNFLLPQFANGKTLELDYDDPTPINHEAADRERNSQSSSAANLVKAGYHPDDVSDAMGLPRMRWVGIPGPSAPATTEEEGGTDVSTARFARS